VQCITIFRDVYFSRYTLPSNDSSYQMIKPVAFRGHSRSTYSKWTPV